MKYFLSGVPQHTLFQVMHYYSNIIAIIYLILIITWEWVWQSGDEGTFEGLGASDRHTTSGEQQQYTSILN